MVSHSISFFTTHRYYLGQQPSNYEMNEMKFDSPHYTTHHYAPPSQQQQQQQQPTQYQVSNAHFQTGQHLYDLNNNNNTYANEQMICYSSASTATTSMLQQTVTPSPGHTIHTLLGPRYSGGSNTSNVLMLPPNQNPRGGGSLPDLRTGDVFYHAPASYSTVPSPSTSSTQRFFRSSSPQQQNNDGDLFILVETDCLNWVRVSHPCICFRALNSNCHPILDLWKQVPVFAVGLVLSVKAKHPHLVDRIRRRLMSRRR